MKEGKKGGKRKGKGERQTGRRVERKEVVRTMINACKRRKRLAVQGDLWTQIAALYCTYHAW